MGLIGYLEARTDAMTVADVARLLKVDVSQCYKLVAREGLSFRIASSVRVDPKTLAIWLRKKMPQP